MLVPRTITGNFNITRVALLSCTVALLIFVLPTIVLADSPAGAEECAKCHKTETDAWQNSPHAQASDNEQLPGATCEGCHGQYVEGHPKEGVMQLSVDSSVCKNCHASTYCQWENSTHAQAGVQCIGCHLSHSQEFRLTDEALCGSCHRDHLDDLSHSVHGAADVACTDCHVTTTISHQLAEADTDELDCLSVAYRPGQTLDNQGTQIDTDEVANTVFAPSHDFVAVSATDCVKCHGPDVHTLNPNIERVADARLLSMAESLPDLTAKLETTEEENKSLQIMVPICLGLGIGLGVMLGIIFMLVVGYILNQRRAEA